MAADERRFGEWLDVVPTLFVGPEEALDLSSARARLGDATWILVRTPTTDPGSPFFALTAVDPDARPSALLEAASSCASACFGVSAPRFTSTLSARARAGEELGADHALVALARSAGVQLSPPSWERVGQIVERARARAPSIRLMLQALRADRRFGTLTSRDPRTGAKPIRAGVEAAFLPVVDGRPKLAALSSVDEIPAAVRRSFEEIVFELEATLERPVRVTFELEGDAARIVTVHSLRRFGLGSFALACDLAAGGVKVDRVLRLIAPVDVAAAVPFRIDADDSAVTITGTAAGTGIAEGRVCLSPQEATAFAQAGLAPILFVHDIEPDDIDAVRASAGVVAVRGGLTGEAAVMARGLAKPCVASGASVTLGPDHLRTAEGAVLRAGERVTIDGSNGSIVRGSHPRLHGEMPAPVQAILHLIEGTKATVVAAVDHPAHVETARRLGASDVAVAHPAALVFDALVEQGDYAASIRASAVELFAAAKGTFGRVFVAVPPADLVLPAPVGRKITEEEARTFVDALREAAASTGVEAAFEGEDASAALVGACSPDAVLAARITAAERAIGNG